MNKIPRALIALGTASAVVGFYLASKHGEPYSIPSWFPGADEARRALQEASQREYKQRRRAPVTHEYPRLC